MWNVKFCDRLLIAPITALHFVQDNTLLAGTDIFIPCMVIQLFL